MEKNPSSSQRSLKAVSILASSDRAEELANVTSLPIKEKPDGPYLYYVDGKLCLGSGTYPKFNPICVDFSSKEIEHRLKTGLNRKDLLIKSIGGVGERPTVIDLTAGLCGDAFHLAAWGCNVIALERNPIIAHLVRDGIERGYKTEQVSILKRLKYIESANTLGSLYSFADPLAIFYFDPMYPNLSKNSLPKKEMQILREVIGDDTDSQETFLALFNYPNKRIVVKRPIQAPLLKENPKIQFKGKAVRFDVY